ncbi:MAG: phospholipase D-like domain-containing protein [Acidobacteriaceae bacterium]|nr:phospholipase D-like domain-containing protein [Acidobacteriaceae bacterium]
MKKKTWHAVLVLGVSSLLMGCQSPAPVRTSGGIETHYSPAENLEAIDTALIRSATKTIDLCAYSLTDHALGQSLMEAAGRGVQVRIYMDQVQTQGELAREDRKSSTEDDEADTTSSLLVLRALQKTSNVQIEVKHSKTLMHLKSYAVDGATLRSGSANFSPTGEKRQDNDLILTHDGASVDRFERNFAVLWARRDNVGLDELRKK